MSDYIFFCRISGDVSVTSPKLPLFSGTPDSRFYAVSKKHIEGL